MSVEGGGGYLESLGKVYDEFIGDGEGDRFIAVQKKGNALRRKVRGQIAETEKNLNGSGSSESIKVRP